MTRTNNNDVDESVGSNRRRFLKTVGALGVVGLAGCGDDGEETPTTADTDDTETDGDDTPTDTETPTATEPPGDTETPTEEPPTATEPPGDTETPTEEPPTETEPPNEFPDPPLELFSFAAESRQVSAGDTLTVEGTLENPYLFEIRNVEVTLNAPEGWDVTGDNSFDAIPSAESRDASWEVVVPESADSTELSATVSYESSDDEATVEGITTVVSVLPPAPDVTVGVTDGLAGQMDASKLSETDGLNLWQAVNQEGRAGVLTQSSQAAQPSVVADASPTGESVARFEGNSDFMTTDAPLTTATEGVTIIVGFRLDDETLPRQVLAFNGSDTGGNGYGIIINSETRSSFDGYVDLLYGGVNWWYSDTTIQDDAFHVVTLIIPGDSPAEPRLFVDGEEVTSEFDTQFGPSPASAPTNQYGIGQDEVTVDVDPYVDGDIGEELVYERELSTEEREQVESYLVDKWVGDVSGE